MCAAGFFVTVSTRGGHSEGSVSVAVDDSEMAVVDELMRFVRPSSSLRPACCHRQFSSAEDSRKVRLQHRACRGLQAGTKPFCELVSLFRQHSVPRSSITAVWLCTRARCEQRNGPRPSAGRCTLRQCLYLLLALIECNSKTICNATTVHREYSLQLLTLSFPAHKPRCLRQSCGSTSSPRSSAVQIRNP